MIVLHYRAIPALRRQVQAVRAHASTTPPRPPAAARRLCTAAAARPRRARAGHRPAACPHPAGPGW
jgi:hypothetical protein